MRLGDLQAKERNAAGTENQHSLAGVQPALFDQGVPGGQGSAGKRRGLLERECGGEARQAGFGEDAVSREDAVDGTAQRGFASGLRDLAGLPGLEEEAGDAIAGFEARDLVTDGNDLSGSVGAKNARQLHLRVVVAQRDGQVAIVQRGGVKANVHLGGAGSCEFHFLGVKVVQAEAVAEAKNSGRAHARLDVSATGLRSLGGLSERHAR